MQSFGLEKAFRIIESRCSRAQLHVQLHPGTLSGSASFFTINSMVCAGSDLKHPRSAKGGIQGKANVINDPNHGAPQISQVPFELCKL